MGQLVQVQQALPKEDLLIARQLTLKFEFFFRTTLILKVVSVQSHLKSGTLRLHLVNCAQEPALSQDVCMRPVKQSRPDGRPQVGLRRGRLRARRASRKQK